MKTLIYILLFGSLAFANSATDSCKKCHPTISSEFESSMHKKSSIDEDKIHKAVWDLHPAKKKGNYSCAKCHTPDVQADTQEQKGISCLSCHTIKDIEVHSKSNKNIYSKEKKLFYSAETGRENEKVTYKILTSWWGGTTTVGSAYHDIDYTNEKFYTGEICMGCHSHKKNAHKFDVCTTDKEGAQDKKQNCITCHMPKVDGTATTVRLSKQHAYHGFAGAINSHEMLSEYVALNLTKLASGFEVSVHNKAPHNLMTHPLRVVQLKATLIREKKHTELQIFTFIKTIGANGKPTMPWLATEVVKDTMIKADEKRIVNFDENLQSGDKVEVVLGYYVVNPKVLKKLNLQDDKELTQFTILKSQYFTIE